MCLPACVWLVNAATSLASIPVCVLLCMPGPEGSCGAAGKDRSIKGAQHTLVADLIYHDHGWLSTPSCWPCSKSVPLKSPQYLTPSLYLPPAESTSQGQTQVLPAYPYRAARHEAPCGEDSVSLAASDTNYIGTYVFSGQSSLFGTGGATSHVLCFDCP